MLEIFPPLDPLIRGLILTAVAVLWTVLLVRIVGLRAFSKMTSFDFVTTVAAGSLIAQAGTRIYWSDFFQALAAIGGVFLIQWLLATARKGSDSFQNLITNKPVLLMEDGEFLESALAETRVSRTSVMEKLRAANVTDPSQVRAVVLETTGNISVLHGDKLDESLIEGIRRV